MSWVSDVSNHLADRKRLQALQWISLIPYEMHARLAAEGILKDTGQWLLNHEKFKKWETKGASGILWLRGDREYPSSSLNLWTETDLYAAGTGKTKLV